MYPDIVANNAQRDEWIKLFAIDEIKGEELGSVAYSNPLTIEFLKANPFLVLDTQFFSTEFKYKLLSSIDNLDEKSNGLLIHSENFQGLNLIKDKYSNKIQCVYIDPPFNTGNDKFCYKDNYQHSSWCSMMNDRLSLAKFLMKENATIYSQIDYTEKEKLKLILDSKFNYITEIIWRIGWLSGYKTRANKFIRNHDTIYQHSISDNPLFNKTYIPYPEGYRRRDGSIPEGEGYPIEDTWNCHEVDSLNSISIISFSKEKMGNDAVTQKNENLIERMVESSSNPNDFILDFFGGSGTTAAVSYKMKRFFITMEIGNWFDTLIRPRIKNILHGDKYGISSKYKFPKSGLVKYIRLESYEDCLDNLKFERSKTQEDWLENNKTAKEEYMLKYMMDLETKDSLLSIKKFDDPFGYKINITRDGEVKESNVDLVETFNYLIGLYVDHIQTFKDILVLEGVTREGEKTLVIWRNTSKTDSDALDSWFKKCKYSTLDAEFDVIYVNGDNNLENLRRDDQTWKVRLIEAEFNKRMFDVQDVK